MRSLNHVSGFATELRVESVEFEKVLNQTMERQVGTLVDSAGLNSRVS